MKIALTHEQADFDALASLLGVYLLDESTIPVLPRRTNRNVKAFVTLYGAELPFVDPRDLPNESIESIVLVDTQSMVSIKGINKSTKIHVIDHHPRRDNLPPEWHVQTTETGATTTCLVEMLREMNGNLSPIQATLLILGIYEDTGSLTYSRTTPRDLKAASYLLESGASLQIANNFLNHPLTKAQQALYDHLRKNVQTLHIHGHTIVIATGDGKNMDEEISTIAHKLRDLLDPDALFVIVKTRGGIQLIARSANDLIDVAEIVGNFGGGGHERAAAALIPGENLNHIVEELKKLLPGMVRPTINVAQIMSRSPRLLSPETPIEKADELMRRYGYEGYPVVEEEEIVNEKRQRIVGLLTRRGVDRALSHKLHVKVNQVMEPGHVSIHPDESIETLQRLMTETGWGQVPVVDPTKGEIIGIVTRTDLLKTLTPQPRLPGRDQIINNLEAVLPKDHLALLKIIAQSAYEQHVALYIVGGFVRDLLLEKPSLDFDLVVEGDAIHLAKCLAKIWGGRVTSHKQFGTAKWHLKDSNFETLYRDTQLKAIDLVSARTEYYTHPTALPIVERGSIKNDLHRRDFTINTLALRLDGRHYGEIHDYYGGLNDLKLGKVRVLHSLSFVDDPTRILRAVRFEKRFNFEIEPNTLKQLNENKHLIERLSGDRIRNELNHILIEPQSAEILNRLNELFLLRAIHPLLTWDEWIYNKFKNLPAYPPSPEWELYGYSDANTFRRDLCYCMWLARLDAEVCRLITGRLKIQAQLNKTILATCQLWKNLPGVSHHPPSEIVKCLEDIPELSRFAVFELLDDEKLRRLLLDYNRVWKNVMPSITGKDLRELGIPPGPHYRKILTRLRDAWLDGEVTTFEAERELLQNLLKELALFRR